MEYLILNQINSPEDVKLLNEEQRIKLCEEIRHFIIETIILSGGHFAANLGVVELTVALNFVFDPLADRMVWDVGHQSYPHKIITGRKKELQGIRHLGGISGFPKISESVYDHFGTGHSSTAISGALGMAQALKLQNKKSKAIAIVGDAALTAGLSFEALNNVMAGNANLLIVINDNHIGIDPNTGAVDLHLQNIESSPANLFTNLGIPYYGPFDGHDLELLCRVFEERKKETTPAVVHIRTVKGKGYEPAEQEQTKWHSTNKYVKISKSVNGKKWQNAFGEILCHLLQSNSKIVGITPAMPSGSGMIAAMNQYPDRVFDVGIAEQHAITFAAGMATQGIIPVVNIYSSFLQRGYDQWIHDVALQKLPVILCIDRAGLVGEDGPTHHGVFDISYLNCIPDVVISAPRNATTLNRLLNTATEIQQPFAIRYPKGEIPDTDFKITNDKLETGKGEFIKKGKHIAVISFGTAGNELLGEIEEHHLDITFWDMIFLKPFDTQALQFIVENHSHIITLEDGALEGGMNTVVRKFVQEWGEPVSIKSFGIADEFVTHGDNHELYKLCGYDAGAVMEYIKSLNVV